MVYKNTRTGDWTHTSCCTVVGCCLCPYGRGYACHCLSLRDGFNILTKKWHAKVRQEEREIGGGNEEIRGVEKLLEELVEMETESEKIEE